MQKSIAVRQARVAVYESKHITRPSSASLVDQMALPADELGPRYFRLFSFMSCMCSVHRSVPSGALLAHLHDVHYQQQFLEKLHLLA